MILPRNNKSYTSRGHAKKVAAKRGRPKNGEVRVKALTRIEQLRSEFDINERITGVVSQK